MTKNAKRLVTLVAAMVMVFAMSITAFAAAPGTYATKLYGPTGTVMTHMNPITGADVEYDDDTEKTTITVYTTKLTVGTQTGYINALTLDGITGEPGSEVTENGVSYPSSFTFTINGEFTSFNTQLPISYSIYMVEGDSHRVSTGSLEIVK